VKELTRRQFAGHALAADTFGLGAAFGLEPQKAPGAGGKVFQILRDQLDAMVADLGATP
jgi:hypothetical protein